MKSGGMVLRSLAGATMVAVLAGNTIELMRLRRELESLKGQPHRSAVAHLQQKTAFDAAQDHIERAAHLLRTNQWEAARKEAAHASAALSRASAEIHSRSDRAIESLRERVAALSRQADASVLRRTGNTNRGEGANP